MYFVFSAFISRPMSLLACKRVSVFSFMVFTLLPNIIIIIIIIINFMSHIVFVMFSQENSPSAYCQTHVVQSVFGMHSKLLHTYSDSLRECKNETL
jgi:hypothetical protein